MRLVFEKKVFRSEGEIVNVRLTNNVNAKQCHTYLPLHSRPYL